MKRILNGREMKLADKTTIETFHIPSAVLMERAALSVVSVILTLAETEPLVKPLSVAFLVGAGNNGGDGLAAARILAEKNIHSAYYFVGDKNKLTPDTKQQKKAADAYGMRELSSLDELRSYPVLVDALFGIGLSREVEDPFRSVIDFANTLPALKIAIDIPSGVSADDGAVLGTAFRADTTVTFAYAKIGHRLFPGRDFTGDLIVSDIGITEQSIAKGMSQKTDNTFELEDFDIATRLPKRIADTHKGSYGKVLCVAGSRDMAGAAYLAAKAAYRVGAGMVKVFTNECNRTALHTLLPEALLSTYPDSEKWNEKCEQKLISDLNWADTIMIGAGLSTSPTAKKILHTVLENASVPLVLDADALNILSENTGVLLKPHPEIVVTPHVIEMARLRGESGSYVKEHLMQTATEFAREYNVICHLKDAVSVTAIPFKETYLNPTGNNGMATAGSGDVLAGIIAGLIASGATPENAAPIGAYLHGKAGDIMAEETGRRSLMAGDLLDGLPRVLP